MKARSPQSPRRTYFVTDKWHLHGVEAMELQFGSHGFLDNWHDRGRHARDGRSFFGKLGGSAFETRAEAVAAVQKKAEAKLRAIQKRHEKWVAFLDRVIVEGVGSVFPPAVQP